MRGRNRPRVRILRILGGVAAVLIGLAAAGFGWAYRSTGTSLAARGIVWGGSQYDDWKRFPSRVVAGGQAPVTFRLEENDFFDDLTIEEVPLQAYLEQTNTTAFLVVRDDALLFEGYFNGSDRAATQPSFSMSKSFASTLLAIAVDEGFVGGLDDPVTSYLPELLERDPRFKAITLRHLVQMTSGLRFDPDVNEPFSDDFVTSHAPDLRQAALNAPIVEPPGQRFLYNDYNPILIGMVLERATGMSVSDYLSTRLWDPMGAEADGSWDLDSERSGLERMSVGLNGRAVDLAKLGWLFLHGGRNGDRQVVPQSWVEAISQGTDAVYTGRGVHEDYYLNFWWLDTPNDAYFAEGGFGQAIYVYPAADLVLVRLGRDTGGVYWTGLLGEIATWLAGKMDA